MALIKCPECGKEISDQAKTCLNCGYSIENHLKEIYKKTIIIIDHDIFFHSCCVKDENNNVLCWFGRNIGDLAIFNCSAKKLIIEEGGGAYRAEINVVQGQKRYYKIVWTETFFPRNIKSFSIVETPPLNKTYKHITYDFLTKKTGEANVDA